MMGMDHEESDRPVKAALVEAALDRAIADGAVTSYFSLTRLLAQLPADFRDEVRQEFESEGPWPDGTHYHVAHIRTDDIPDGEWCVRFPDVRRPACYLIIASDPVRYSNTQANIQSIIARKSRMMPFN